MGYAQIVSGGETGRYTIQIDYGSATVTAVLAALTVRLAELDTRLATLQVKIAEADAKEQAQLEIIREAEELYILQMTTLPEGSVPSAQGILEFARLTMGNLLRAHAPLRLQLSALKHERSIALGRVAFWNGFDPLVTKQAWCTDYTEDGPAGSYAATIDIPGEPSLQLIAPGCRPWIQSDGTMVARELMSPEQAFFNAAILPGWQKFKPTYRWGTITALDYELNTASVSLAAAVSTAQRLGVNSLSSLSAVPVEYMTCDARAFEVGDRCVVQFVGQSWASPKVVGFLEP
jgi:hypothetical protein